LIPGSLSALSQLSRPVIVSVDWYDDYNLYDELGRTARLRFCIALQFTSRDWWVDRLGQLVSTHRFQSRISCSQTDDHSARTVGFNVDKF